MKSAAALFFLFLLLFSPLSSVTVDLRDPEYAGGILTTSSGGVVTGQNFRIQAQTILYEKREESAGTIERVVAEGDLIVEFGCYVLVGKKIEFNVTANQGTIYEGRTTIFPWFFGGEEIQLLPDGSYRICNGFATTSETAPLDWQLSLKEAHLDKAKFLTANNIRFQIYSVPLIWIPKFRINLDSIFHSPFRYTVRFGGPQGARVGVSYDAFDYGGFQSRLILDYRFSYGLGGGADIRYKSPDCKKKFYGVNYLARDLTTSDDKVRTRYRFMGIYSHCLDRYNMNIKGSYDFLSDMEMATDFADRGLKFETGKRTQLEVLKQESDWTLNFLARFRVNNFQTVNQELPTLFSSLRPFNLGSTGIICDSQIKLSYLDLEFTKDVKNQKNIHSPRYEVRSLLYRPFEWLNASITPQAGLVAIYYGNNSKNNDRWNTIGLFELDARWDLFRFFGSKKHVVTPYVSYQYYTYPETSPKDHFIFDINDGWYYLNKLAIGIENNLYSKTAGGCIWRNLFADCFLVSFFDTKTIPRPLYKSFLNIVYNQTPYIRHTVQFGYDIERGLIDHLNIALGWTINHRNAISLEYRKRSAFDYRKVDHTNYILDSFQPEEVLTNSNLSSISDRRDTLLLNYFYKFHPNWAFNFQSRNGWNRKTQPSYFEYELNLLGKIRTSWNLRVSYKHKEDEDRFSFNFSVGFTPPEPVDPACVIPCVEF